MILLLVGIIEFGLLFYNKQVLTNASREGARAGIAYDLDEKAYPTDEDIGEIVTDYCASRLIRFDTEVNPLPMSLATRRRVLRPGPHRRVSYNYTFLAPDLLDFGPNLQLTAQTVMKMESVPDP